MIKWRFVQRVSKQMTSFKNVIICVLNILNLFQGLSDVIPLHKLKVFDEREVEVSCSFTFCIFLLVSSRWTRTD
jgi:hypothetical protein